MSLEPGRMLLHYRLVEKIGEGGMGVVWRALDTKLDREIALKVLPEAFAGDPERLGRFEREAKVVASLNHPNIVTLHSVEKVPATDSGGPSTSSGGPSTSSGQAIHFITMELVKGRPLSEMVPRRGFSLEKFFELAIPLVDAVAAAHESGVTHRDLKPANVMVDDAGRLRVLDFGLAKSHGELTADGPGTQMATATVTEEGKILGTVAYMSPEQAEAKPVDLRSDIFSLGVMLYELATGRRPFSGDTSVSIISSILKDTPASVTELNHALPRHLGRIVRRCLQKDRERRYQSAKDLRNDLVELREEVDSGEVQPAGAETARGGRRSWIGYAVLLLVAAALIVAMRFWPGGDSGDAATGGSLAPSVTQLTRLAGWECYPSVSPDGKAFVYVSSADGDWDIYYQRVGGQNPINLTDACDREDTQPAFSPDGERIAYRSECDGGGVFVMGATGESVRRISDFGFDPAWSPDGTRLAVGTIRAHYGGRASGSELWMFGVDEPSEERIESGRPDAVQPSWSPSGGRIAYVSGAEGGGRLIYTASATGGEAVRVTTGGFNWSPAWSPDGQYLYFASDRGGSWNLWRVSIDEPSGELRGEPEPVTTGGSAERLLPRLSADGKRIVYFEGFSRRNIERIPLDPTTRAVTGSVEAITAGTGLVGFPSPSPDDLHITFTGRGNPEDIYVIAVDGTGERRLTRGESGLRNRSSVWSPDGTRIAFQRGLGTTTQIWAIRPDGSGLEPLTDMPDRLLVVPSWAPDGDRISVVDPGTLESFVVDLKKPLDERTLEPFPPLDGETAKFFAVSWSPDGSWIAGNSEGLEGIILYSLERGTYRRLLDTGAIEARAWFPDSRTLVFTENGEVYTLDIDSLDRRELLAPDPPTYITKACMSFQGRWLYYTRVVSEADIWMLDL